jgi:acyl dehydratase
MHFADLRVGQTFESPGRPITESEIVEFARRYDPQPFHVDPESAGARRWGGLIASGWMTCSVAMALGVELLMMNSDSMGSPGVESVEWPQPVRPGDELRLRVEVLETRLSRTGRVGVVKWRWQMSNQTDTVVLRMVATSLFDLSASGAPT